MDVERSIEMPVAAMADGGAAVLRDLKARMHRAVESARRDGPTGERLFRRSMAVYAGEASREHVPEEWFLGVIHHEILATLSSRVSTKRLGHLIDVAAQGAMDGYDLQHHLERLEQARWYANAVPDADAPGNDARSL
jgi:hypothetical protein